MSKSLKNDMIKEKQLFDHLAKNNTLLKDYILFTRQMNDTFSNSRGNSRDTFENPRGSLKG